VHVQLENRTGAAFTGYLSVEENDLDGDKARSVSSRFTLDPGNTPRDLWLYYWPRPDDDQGGAKAVQVLDESRRVVATLRAPALSEILLPGIRPETSDMREEHSTRWVLVIGRSPMGLDNYRQAQGGVASVRYTQLTRATDLPDRALGLDGVDTIIWEADADQCTVSQTPPEYQLKAIHDWVRAGGHLIVTTGALWRETFNPAAPLADMLPMAVDDKQPREGSREIPNGDTIANWIGRIIPPRGATPEEAVAIKGPFVQVAGHLKPGATVIRGSHDVAGAPPLVVTGSYGAGTVTLVTIDMSAKPLELLTPRQWLAFWQKTAGWPGAMLTEADYVAYDKVVRGSYAGAAAGDEFLPNPNYAALDSGVAGAIDFTRQTAVRLLLAFGFLAVYWCLAGPVSHLVLRHYHVAHWSWWIFGAVVIGASAAAVLVVEALRLENYDVKHRTYVMGSVNESEASVVGYYGIFAPVNGNVSLELPAATGLTYLAPFNEPRFEGGTSFVDPQHYDINDDLLQGASESNLAKWGIRVPFRSTLKKMQGRWVGPTTCKLAATNLRAVYKTGLSSTHPPLAYLEGKLTNQTPYPLKDISIIAMVDGVPPGAMPIIEDSRDTIFDATSLAPGATLDLATMLTKRQGNLWSNLDSVGIEFASSHRLGMSTGSDPVKTLAGLEKHQEELLNILLDTRPPGGDRAWNVGGLTQSAARVEFKRHFTRLIDRSQSLRASGLLIIAHAGDPEHGVASPIPIKVAGKDIPGTGEILFTWTATLDK